MEEKSVKFLKISEIDQKADYSLRYSFADPLLKLSLEKFGVQMPLAVATPEKGKTRQLIAGHKRLAAARELGFEAVPVYELSEQSPGKLFAFALLSNLNQGWTDLDRSSALRKATEVFHFSQEEVTAFWLPVLGLVPSPKVLNYYLAAAKLDPELQKLIAAGLLAFRGSWELAVWPADEQHLFAQKVAAPAALSANDLTHAVRWTTDLKRQGKSLSEILSRQEIREIFENSVWDRVQKGRVFMTALRHLRYPNLTRFEDTFTQISHQALGPLKDIRLNPPENFEDEGFYLNASLRDKEGLTQLEEFLKDKKDLLNSLFDIKL